MNDGTMIESGLGTMVINDGEDDSTMKSELFSISFYFFLCYKLKEVRKNSSFFAYVFIFS